LSTAGPSEPTSTGGWHKTWSLIIFLFHAYRPINYSSHWVPITQAYIYFEYAHAGTIFTDFKTADKHTTDKH